MKRQHDHFKLEDVDKLSRGKRTGKRIGSRAVGHHLQAFERREYQRANQCGFMTVNAKSRSNLWDIWQKATHARGWPCLILLKHLDSGQGEILSDGKRIYAGDLKGAKQRIKGLAKEFI